MNLDKIINLIREMNEEMTVGGGGFVGSEPEGSAPQKSAGYDKVMKLMKRKKNKKYMKSGVSYNLWRGKK